MELPFGQAKELEAQIDTFLDTVVKSVLGLKDGVRSYLDHKQEEFESLIKAVTEYEHQADDIRKHTKTTLYAHALIPESRGDVLGLLENIDTLADDAKEILQQFDVQQPELLPDLNESFLQVTDASIESVDNVVMATRSFFRNPSQVKDYINKVDFYESEADRTGLILKKKIFRAEIPLARKLHLRYFAELLESLSDTAENIGERLAIATIKRQL